MSKATSKKLLSMASSFPATVMIHKADGGYWVESPQFSGCFASGDSLNDALVNFKSALFEYFEIPVKSQNMDALRYASPDFPEPTKQSQPKAVQLIQSPDLLFA